MTGPSALSAGRRPQKLAAADLGSPAVRAAGARRTKGLPAMTATTASQADADHALKARHRAMWALERAAALDDELVDLARRADGGSGAMLMDWEYLLVTATKRVETVPAPR